VLSQPLWSCCPAQVKKCGSRSASIVCIFEFTRIFECRQSGRLVILPGTLQSAVMWC
jgi:hypothetical protein